MKIIFPICPPEAVVAILVGGLSSAGEGDLQLGGGEAVGDGHEDQEGEGEG